MGFCFGLGVDWLMRIRFEAEVEVELEVEVEVRLFSRCDIHFQVGVRSGAGVLLINPAGPVGKVGGSIAHRR